MTKSILDADAVVIGGGFYGAAVAIYLAKCRHLKRIILIEKEKILLNRASFNNQARVHNGYHYPRSLITASRSRINFSKFIFNWPEAIKKDFKQLYAIGRINSKVNHKQFERFCDEIGAKTQSAEIGLKKLFDPRYIEAVYQVEEMAFDANKLRDWASKELKEFGVEVNFSSRVTAISRANDSRMIVSTVHKNATETKTNCRYVFNCAYSGLNQVPGDFSASVANLKHEVAELALVQVPDMLKGLGVTVVDGPYFSIMPFPARQLHSLSHVRYTPHFSWCDERGIDPYKQLSEYNQISRVDRMLRDAGRYLPSILGAKYVDSIFEVKTILAKNEGDDGRPILFEKHDKHFSYYSILGGKIDNVYDVLERLDSESIE